MKILVVNAGSSSLKYQLFDLGGESKVIAKGLLERIGIEGRLKHTPIGKSQIVKDVHMDNHADAMEVLMAALTDPEHGVVKNMSEIEAVGHRVVHVGEYYSDSVIIDDQVMKAIEECVELAPLHNPPNILGIKACEKLMPGVPQVAVFDTAFHQTMPKHAFLYAIPYEYYEKYKVRKYGFHGTSHKYVANRAAQILGKPLEELNLITCHLGNGSSITAIKQGKSIDTSMGFTPLAGVVMGTRCGDIDPAIVEYIGEKENISCKEVLNILNKKSGVLGISEYSSDFRDLAECNDEHKEQCKLAIDIFIYTVKRRIGICCSILGALDGIVFTAGVGENNAYIREKILENLDFLGISIDKDKNNDACGKEADITADGARVSTLVIPTNEELMIAMDTKRLVEG